MPNLTVRADESLLADLDADAEERGVSRAEYVRRELESRHESDERVAALESELAECQSKSADLETELERTKRAHRQLLDQREEHTELVRAVERERTLEERRASAGVLTRARWWFTGVPEEE